MKVTVVEGTPEEMAVLFPGLGLSPISVVKEASGAVPVAPPSSDVASDGGSVSVEVARKVLRRRSLAPKQLEVLKTLYKAHPQTVLGSDIQKQIGYTRPEFSGFMGAFGRRVTNTTGHKAGSRFIDKNWDSNLGTYRYGLPDTVREAMELEKLV